MRLWTCLYSPDTCPFSEGGRRGRDETLHFFSCNHPVAVSLSSALRSWGPWRTAPAAMITPKASTALMASTVAASSCACSKHCLCPTMPPPAPSSCSAGESLSPRPGLSLHSSGRDAGKRSGTTAWPSWDWPSMKWPFFLCFFSPRGKRQQYNLWLGIEKKNGRRKINNWLVVMTNGILAQATS